MVRGHPHALTIIGEVFMNALERKRAEEELQKAKNMLEIRVEERTRDLKKANKLLEAHISQLNFLNTSFMSSPPLSILKNCSPPYSISFWRGSRRPREVSAASSAILPVHQRDRRT